MNNAVKKIITLIAFLFITHVIHAQTSISGKVIDESGEPLPGASLLIIGSIKGTAADANGDYTLASSQALPWTIQVTFVGFATKILIVNSNEDQRIITLSEGVLLGEEVIISASRVPEKVLDAVASVTVLDADRLEATPVNGSMTEYLRNVQGVNIVRNGTMRSNIELRGPVNVLETSTMVLKDFAPLSTPSDKIFYSFASTLSPLDIATIEVVRGPSGALYGPNVTSGVVHFISKDAFRYPGASTMVSVGERNLLTTRIRYAANDGKKLGWKFLINYSQSHDFAIAEDQIISNDGITKVVTPQDFETLGGKRWEDIDNLDDIRLYNWNFEGGLEYHPSDQTKLNYTVGLIRALSNVAIPIGHALLGVQRFEQQIRINSGNFFGAIFHRHTFANVDSNGNPNNLANHAFTLNYTGGVEGETQFATSQTAEKYLDVALQYRINVNNQLNFQIGSDLKYSPAFEKVFAYGASSGNNAYNIYGGYLSGKYHFHEKLTLNAAGRYDYFSAYEQSAFSPRLGLVYKHNESSNVRLSFSRSFEGQSRERTFLDFNFSSVLPPFFPASHINGVAQPVTYNNPVTRFAFGDVQGGSSFDLQNIVNVLAANAGVAVPLVSGSVNPTLTSSTFVGPEVGMSTGIPISLNQAGLKPPILRTVNQVEFGLSKTISQKLKLNLDLYNIWIENIQPTGEVALSAGAQVDVASVQSMIEQQVPAGPDRDAMIASLYSVPFNPTPNPAFNGTPGYGAVMSDKAQQYGYVFDIGFPTYDNKNVNYLGMEFSASYLIKMDLSLFGNFTHVSKNIWSADDLGEINPEYKYYLNTPKDRINLGINYIPSIGFYGSVAMNYQSAYEGRQGDGRFFTGFNKARAIYDLQLGYRLKTTMKVKFDFGLSVNNIFDKKYSYFVHLGQLRRFSAFTLKVGF